MKRLSLMIMVVLLIGVFLAACAYKSAPTKIPSNAEATSSSTKIRIGTDATLPPFEFYDMNKKAFTGFEIDLMKTVAAAAGLEVTFINVPLNQLLAFLPRCQLEAGISAITITDALKQQMDFSEPYITVGQVIVVKEGNITITGLERLSGMVVGSWQASPNLVEILKIPGAQLKIYDSADLAFQDLITGYIDAVIADSPRAQSYVNIKANNLKIVGEELDRVDYGIAICKDRPDLIEKINNGLAVLKADGELDKLAKKWKIEVGQE